MARSILVTRHGQNAWLLCTPLLLHQLVCQPFRCHGFLCVT